MSLVQRILFYEVCHHMSLQVIDVNERNSQTSGEPFRKADTYKQRAHKARTACECDGGQLFFGHICAYQSLVYHRYDILHVGS